MKASPNKSVETNRRPAFPFNVGRQFESASCAPPSLSAAVAQFGRKTTRMITFKPGCRAEADKWSLDGEKITSPEKLAAIRQVLEKEGPVLVEHKFLRGARAPHTTVFDDYDDFIAYLTEHARSGDKITVWNVWPFMRDTAPLARGKCPAEDGAVPEGGAY